MNPTDTFEALFQGDGSEPPHAYMIIDFARPDGDGIFSSVYDVLYAVDIATINKNICDGYRVIAISPEVRS
jgi:hypothetical protein